LLGGNNVPDSLAGMVMAETSRGEQWVFTKLLYLLFPYAYTSNVDFRGEEQTKTSCVFYVSLSHEEVLHTAWMTFIFDTVVLEQW
jgi:hypothetical protein